jgi:hypothetical protein
VTLRLAALGLVLTADVALSARSLGVVAPSQRVVVLGPAPRPLPAPTRWDHPLASLTSDDVVRGLWALQREGSLTPAQLAVIEPMVAQGASQRVAIGQLRMRQRELLQQELLDRGSLAVAAREEWPSAVHR